MGTENFLLAARPVVFAALGLVLLIGSNAAVAQPGSAVAAASRVIVQPRAGLAESEVQKVAQGLGASARKVGKTGLYILELPPGLSNRSVAAGLMRNPHFKLAEPDMLVPPNMATNDPYFGNAWHLPKIGATTVWDSVSTSSSVIAVLDTGVNAAHVDLVGKVLPGWNFYNNNSDTSDTYNHGTMVAGAAAAAGNNGVGVVGVALDAKIVPYRISDASGYGQASAVVQALSDAADRGIRVANISYNFNASSSVRTAAQYFKDRGGLVFMSAGNSGTEDTSAATTSWISVAATDTNDARPSWSSWGKYVSLSAPAVNIYTTSANGAYVLGNGNSFSTPVAAATALMVFAARPTLKSTEAEQILFSSATDLGTAGRDSYFGHGRVNALAAVQQALGFAPKVDATAPSVSVTSPTLSSTVSGIVPVDVAASDDVGVSKVELRINGALLATDASAPFAFSWDSTKVANGISTLIAVAFDAAGNSSASQTISVNVNNVSATADATPPSFVAIAPASGSTMTGTSTTITASATDNAGASGLTQRLYIDGKLVTTVTGGTLSYRWNTRKVAKGQHTFTVTATDAAGNAVSATAILTK